jgi:hypothetical protein
MLYYLLLSLLAVTIVVSLKGGGNHPRDCHARDAGCIGYLLTDRFNRMLVIATTTAVSSSLIGVYLSFFLNASTGACIVLLQAAIFLVALFFAPKHGLLAARDGSDSWRASRRCVNSRSRFERRDTSAGALSAPMEVKIPRVRPEMFPRNSVTEKHSPAGLRKAAEHASLFAVPCVFHSDSALIACSYHGLTERMTASGKLPPIVRARKNG